ncbi:MAG: DUF3597 domain-containing protein [Verrucomicrobiota bacterium]|nr:DUF3597 domain-containing protein [Verrucomicrobiota bacterium]
MGLFNTLMTKIFSHAPASGTSSTPATSAPAGGGNTQPAGQTRSATAAAPASGTSTSAPGASSATAAPAQQVDVAAVLDGLASKNSEKLDWKHSIVDLMKLVGMDSSLSARKELATDLHYTGDQSDSAAMNIWLHEEVLKKLSENGGKVPAELLKH